MFGVSSVIDGNDKKNGKIFFIRCWLVIITFWLNMLKSIKGVFMIVNCGNSKSLELLFYSTISLLIRNKIIFCYMLWSRL